jgi:hypothetical protein
MGADRLQLAALLAVRATATATAWRGAVASLGCALLRWAAAADFSGNYLL